MSSALHACPKWSFAILASGLLDAVPAGALSAVVGSAVPKERAGQLMRMDRLCGLAVSAADQLLSSAPSLLDRSAWLAERIGVLVGSSRGCHKTDEEYFRSYIDGQPSPRLLPIPCRRLQSVRSRSCMA
jgi:3-oxoacyl-(acyl-carrier-protein) synthase